MTCVLFTGLSAAGKTTYANKLATLLDKYEVPYSLLDGDVLRGTICKGLGFSREDRDENVRRVAFVAKEIVKSGGVVIISIIAPYQHHRQMIREAIESVTFRSSNIGQYIEVFVDTPIEECIRRDPKKLYESALAGKIPNFTGVSDPYERPTENQYTISDQDPSSILDTIREAIIYQTHSV